MSSRSDASPKNARNGSKNVHSSKQECPLKKKSTIVVQVDALAAKENKPPSRTGISGVKAEILSGPTEPPSQKTSGAGRCTFPDLDVGSYSVGITVAGGLARYYDLEPPPPPQQKTTRPGQTANCLFELRSFWLRAKITYADGKAVKGVDFKIDRKGLQGGVLDKNWSPHHEGPSDTDPYAEDFVPKGRYLLSFPEVSNPTWSLEKAVVAEPVDAKAEVTGIAAGTAGTIAIYDACNFTKPLETLNATVAADGQAKVLKAAWTPEKAKLADLKSGSVVFEAKVGKAGVFSQPIPVVSKEKFEVADGKGTKLDATLSFYFSGGAKVDAAAAGGEAEVLAPWGQTVARISVDGHNSCGATLTEEGAAARKFQLPA